MFIFVYGKDQFRSRQKISEIIENYKKSNKSGLNLVTVDLREKDVQELKGELQSASMFNEKKLVIIRNAFQEKDIKEQLIEFLKKIIKTQDIILVYEEGEIRKNDRLFNFLKKNAKCQEFNFLEGQVLRNWIKKETSIFNKEISREALDGLIEFAGNDTWRLSNEIKKLVNYSGKTIARKDVESLVKPKIETDIFKTIDAIALKDRKKALLLIHQHLEKGDSPLYLLAMINFQFRNLLTVKDLIEKNINYYDISKITKLHPFVVKKSYQQAQKFKFEELKKIYLKIFQVDSDIKTGKVETSTALDLLISNI